ncbi:MAG: glycosyltransferase [Patulibacter sp.]|nr:glycosyltransferase [Patulibacter sp.]
MSDAPPPSPAGATPDPQAELARLQQRTLEQDLRVADLERTLDHLTQERGVLAEQLRMARKHAGIEGAARQVKTYATARVRDLRHRELPPAPGIPLASLPVTRLSDAPQWVPASDVAGDARPAILADPPGCWRWDLDLPAGTALRGAAALRPGAWDVNHGGVDLVVELLAGGPDAGEEATRAVVASTVVSVDPGARAADRRWIAWRLALPATGPHRLVLRTRLPEGASPDYAWMLIGDPQLEVPGLAPRPADAGRGSDLVRGARRRRGGGTATSRPPEIALLLPVHDPDIGLLDRTLASVAGQTSAAWQLRIVDDGSKDPVVRDRLLRAAAEDPRIVLHRHDTAQGISSATNTALERATAPFVATLDHDDVLAPDAIETMATRLASEPDLDVLYSDNDLLAGDARRFAAALKPDWSPDLLRACMYTLHFSVYRRALVEAVGGWRSTFDGAQDHDLVLRLSERTDRIGHVPRILYHWRAHAGSAALGELAKPLAYDRGRAAIAEHLERTGQGDATVERLPQAGRYRMRYPRTLPVEMVVPLPDAAAIADLEASLRGLLAVLRPSDTVVVTAAAGARGGTGPDTIDGAVRAVGDGRVRVDGDGTEPEVDRVVVTLARPLVPGTPDVIDELAGFVEAGATRAGGVVTTADHRVVTGAVAAPRGLPVRLHIGADLSADDRHPMLTMVTNQVAVEGAVASRIGPTAATDHGPERVIWSPHAVFVASDAAADALLVTALEGVVRADRGDRPDPFWNPQLWPDRGDATVPESVHENPLLDVVDR